MTLQDTPLEFAAASALNAPPERITYAIRFPEPEQGLGCEQDEEWCEVYVAGEWQRLRLHDYAEIYRTPGLYEDLFGRVLRCTSPQRVVGLFAEVLRDGPQSPMELSALDLGAGNGMVGEQLRTLGIRSLVGIDIIPEAAEASERDRPGLYDDYIVADLCRPTDNVVRRLSAGKPNCLTTVSALGFGDIPPRAFGTAFNAVMAPGWIVFNIKEAFLNGNDESGFSRLIRALCDRGIMQIQAYRRYSHRLSVGGRPLSYVAMVARKLRGMPASLPDEVR